MFKSFCSSHRKLVLVFILFLILFFRLSTLELLDLVDTTESRYAAVATKMFDSGDWTTPKIPSGTSYVPYLGKPPLHFWLMSEAYNLFGIDEWTSRLPSFFSLIAILSSFFLLGKCHNNMMLALRASAILCSSLLMFTLSGIVMLDVTLTAFVSLSIISAFLYIERFGLRYLYLFWISLGLGFLVKGPAVVLFSALPLVALEIYQGKFKSLFKLLSPIGIISFLFLVVPWFYLSEQANPGFLKYFFLNENVLRYVTKNYGDLYGHGHVEPYGTALWMFALGFFPWTTLAIGYFFSNRSKDNFLKLFSAPIASLGFFWMILPIVFLVFIRQLHFGYVIPAIPGAALWLAEMSLRKENSKVHFAILNVTLAAVIFLCPFVAVIFGANLTTILFGLIALAFCLFVYRLKLGAIETLATLASISYFLIYLSWSPIVGSLRSTNTVMSCITQSTSEFMPEVAVLGERSFSANWLSAAWSLELDQPFKLSFIKDGLIVPESADFLLQSKKDPTLTFPYLEKNSEVANWRIYSRLGEPKFDCSLAPWKDSNCCRYHWDPESRNRIARTLFQAGKYLWGVATKD